jgi:hypothetical protein
MKGTPKILILITLLALLGAPLDLTPASAARLGGPSDLSGEVILQPTPGLPKPPVVTLEGAYTPTVMIQQIVTPTATIQQPDPTATVTTPAPTATQASPTATEIPPTPSPTNTQMPVATTQPVQSLLRPLVVVESYKAKPNPVKSGQNFDLVLKLVNQGPVKAVNLMVAFTPGDFLPRETGGVLAVGELAPGETRRLEQALNATSAVEGKHVATLETHINYGAEDGTAYSESFTIAVNVTQPKPPGSGSGSAPSPTPTAITRPQLVISSYQTDQAQLQPGTQFNLQLEVKNTGNADARRVTMIVGGATVNTGSDPNNENPEGVSGSGGEFTNFSPLGVSNVHSLGDLPAGDSLQANQPLIVNVTTEPGAYSLKVSFAYNDEKGNLRVDDQVISLLVFLTPVVEVNFYRDPGPMFAGQPNQIPLQIINLGRKSTVLGNMTLSATNGQMMNNTTLIGTLEAGGYFTLDATWTPDSAGTMTLTVKVDYTDDFNQPQSITRQVALQVMEAPVMEPQPYPGMGEGAGLPPQGQAETSWQKALRFVRGLIGLDSSPPSTEPMPPFPGEMPPEGSPSQGGGFPPAGGKG